MTARCQSCGRSISSDACRHPDCGWRPPSPYGPVDPARGLEWVRATRALLHAIQKDTVPVPTSPEVRAAGPVRDHVDPDGPPADHVDPDLNESWAAWLTRAHVPER